MTPRITHSGSIPTLLGLALLCPGFASAEDVVMKDATAFVTGTAKVKVDGVSGSCSNFASLDVDFRRKKFSGIDNEGKLFEGRFKQKGTDGRKLVGELTSKSKKRIVKSAKGILKACLDTNDVNASGSGYKFIAKVNKDRDMLKVKGSARLEGSIEGDSGTGKYTVKMQGSLTLAPAEPAAEL
ncbi:MAG: hypothetical protein ACQGVK_07765 [Myxococcota bacterium]